MAFFQKYKVSFIFLFLVFFTIILPYIVLAQTEESYFKVCEGIDCRLCDLVTLADKIIDFLIVFAVSIAAISFAYAGVLYITSAGNTGQVTKAHDIFFNVFWGLVIALVAWLVIDTLMKAFLNHQQFGPWNQIECQDAQRREAPEFERGEVALGTRWGKTWRCESAGGLGSTNCSCSAASPGVYCSDTGEYCDLGIIGEGGSLQCQSGGTTHQPPGPPKESAHTYRCQGPTAPSCTCSVPSAAPSGCTDTGQVCATPGRQIQCPVTPPPGTAGTCPTGVTFDPGISNQCSHTSPALNSILTCMKPKLDAQGIPMHLNSISDNQIVGGKTFAQCNAGGCAHKAGSCHYGNGGSCSTSQSYAADISANQSNKGAIRQAAQECGATSSIDEVSSANHVHVNASATCGCT